MAYDPTGGASLPKFVLHDYSHGLDYMTKPMTNSHLPQGTINPWDNPTKSISILPTKYDLQKKAFEVVNRYFGGKGLLNKGDAFELMVLFAQEQLHQAAKEFHRTLRSIEDNYERHIYQIKEQQEARERARKSTVGVPNTGRRFRTDE